MGVPLPPSTPPASGLTGHCPLGCPFRQGAGLRVATRVAEAGAGAAHPGLGSGEHPAAQLAPARHPLRALRVRGAPRCRHVCARYIKHRYSGRGARGVKPAQTHVPAGRQAAACFWEGGGGKVWGTLSAFLLTFWVCLNVVSTLSPANSGKNELSSWRSHCGPSCWFAGPPVAVGMNIDIASIDMVSEVNMVSI